MPHNFSFVIPDKLAGMGRPPYDGEELRRELFTLRRQGVGGLVCLAEMPPRREVVEEEGLEFLHLPVVDFAPPTLEQVRQMAGFVDRVTRAGQAVAVHCGAGLGRTGTMLACYLVHLGETPENAVRSIRTIRPGSIETSGQENCVFAYADSLSRTGGARGGAAK